MKPPYEKKIIYFVDRGGIARSRVAEEITKKELQKRGLSSEYSVMSGRTQGEDPEDPNRPEYPTLVDYPEHYKIAEEWLLKRGINLNMHQPIDIMEHFGRLVNKLLYGEGDKIHEISFEDIIRDNYKLLRGNISMPVQRYFIEKAKVVFAMDTRTIEALKRIEPYYKDKYLLFSDIAGKEKPDVKDPHEEGPSSIVEIFNQIETTITQNFERLLEYAEGKVEIDIERHTEYSPNKEH